MILKGSLKFSRIRKGSEVTFAASLVMGSTQSEFGLDENAMRHKLISQQPKTFVLIFDVDDEITEVLKRFAADQHLGSSSFKAIGALSSAKLGWFNWNTKKYEVAADLNEQLELLSLIGDIALQDGKPQVHSHVIVGKYDGTAHGGHLLQAKVRPTCELVLTENPAELRKEIDPEVGLALIKL